MAIKRRHPFSPKSFLAKVGEGRSIHAYPREQIVFSQGDPADAVFYIQRGKVKVTVVSKPITSAGRFSPLGPVGICGSRGNIIPFPIPKVGNAKTGDLYSVRINDDDCIKINYLQSLGAAHFHFKKVPNLLD
jgi:hypothetical protein